MHERGGEEEGRRRSEEGGEAEGGRSRVGKEEKKGQQKIRIKLVRMS